MAAGEFVLRRVKENISVPGWGAQKNDRARTDKWLVRLEPSVEWVKGHVESLQRQAFAPLPAARPALQDPDSFPVPAEGPEPLEGPEAERADAPDIAF